jgi:hypothetical protein
VSDDLDVYFSDPLPPPEPERLVRVKNTSQGPLVFATPYGASDISIAPGGIAAVPESLLSASTPQLWLREGILTLEPN